MASKNGRIFFNCHRSSAHHQIANQVFKKNSHELENLEPRTCQVCSSEKIMILNTSVVKRDQNST